MKGDPSTSAFYAIATKAFAREDRGVSIKKAAHEECWHAGIYLRRQVTPGLPVIPTERTE